MKLISNLVIASSLLLCAQAPAQTLIYALSYAETPGSFRNRFPNGTPGASIDDKLAMIRRYQRTEIYSVSMTDGKRSLLFSDNGMHLEIIPTGASVGGGKAYAKGIMWEWRTTPNPGAYSQPPAIYEIRLDGSNGLRRLAEIPDDQSPGFMNVQAKKAVVETSLNSKYQVSVYDVSTWKLLHSWDLARVSQAHCPGCFPMSYGWLADGDRLFINLEDADAGGDDEPANVVTGTYMATEDGRDLGGVPKHTGEFQSPGYVRPLGSIPHLIGQLPNGDYLFHDYGPKEGPSAAKRSVVAVLVLTGPDFRFRKQIPLPSSQIRSFYPSPSGRYLAYIENRSIPNYQTQDHVWGRNLGTGEEKELFVGPPPNPVRSPEPTVGFTVLGWIDNN